MMIFLSDMKTKKRVRSPDAAAGLPAGAMMESDVYLCYILNGIPYLPHYHERVYVRPGYGKQHHETFLAIELKALGAQTVEMGLWKRAAF